MSGLKPFLLLRRLLKLPSCTSCRCFERRDCIKMKRLIGDLKKVQKSGEANLQCRPQTLLEFRAIFDTSPPAFSRCEQRRSTIIVHYDGVLVYLLMYSVICLTSLRALPMFLQSLCFDGVSFCSSCRSRMYLHRNELSSSSSNSKEQQFVTVAIFEQG